MRKHVPNLELIEERFWNHIKDTEIYKEYRWAPEFKKKLIELRNFWKKREVNNANI